MATFSTSEYTRTITVSKSHLEDMIIAQNKSNKVWDGKLSNAEYKESIFALSATVIGFVFKTTAAGVVYTVMTGAISWATTSYKKNGCRFNCKR